MFKSAKKSMLIWSSCLLVDFFVPMLCLVKLPVEMKLVVKSIQPFFEFAVKEQVIVVWSLGKRVGGSWRRTLNLLLIRKPSKENHVVDLSSIFLRKR